MSELTEAERLGCDPREIVEWPWTTASPGRYVRTETAARIKADTHAAAYDKGHAAGVADGRAEVAALRERVEALADEWERKAAETRAEMEWVWLEPDNVVRRLRAALAGTSPQPGTLEYAQMVAERYGDLDDAAIEDGMEPTSSQGEGER